MDEKERVIVATADGSPTISIPSLGITYHSKHGALQESVHIFIKCGLDEALGVFPSATLCVFEMGFGTGLNAWLTLQQAAREKRTIHYTSIEQYPLTATEVAALNYEGDAELFKLLHAAPWNNTVPLNAFFTLKKVQDDLLNFAFSQQFHLIYFDAFSPEDQPQLWTTAVFKKIFDALFDNGILLTYCSKSRVRKAMQEAGFTVEKIPGPRGKREIVRARKLSLDRGI